MTPMALKFGNGVTLDFGPRNYAYELRKGIWCMGVFDNEHNGAVIGGATMRNYEVCLRMLFLLFGELNPEIWQKRGPTYGRNGSFSKYASGLDSFHRARSLSLSHLCFDPPPRRDS